MAPMNKPAFSFNTSSFGGSGLFNGDGQQQMDGSWDMGDDASDTTHDDSRALTFHNEQDETLPIDTSMSAFYREHCPEIDAFALLVDSSSLAPPGTPRTPGSNCSGYELIEKFEEVSSEHCQLSRNYLEECTSRENATEEEMQEARADIEHWELEHQTWELFATLSIHRLELDKGVSKPEIPTDLKHNRYTSNTRVKEHLLATDKKFKEWVLILQWLWKYAPDPTGTLLDAEDKYRGGGWMYTKEALKSRKRLAGNKLKAKTVSFGAKDKGRDLITELDPDAPTRQGKHLEEEDEECDEFLMKVLWAFIRKGDLEGAKELCADVGEWWRGMSLAGGEEAWDDVVDGKRQTQEEEDAMTYEGSLAKVHGNRRRELWRRMCFAIARRQGGDKWESAVYGTLCGDIDSVTTVCQTWEDHLFAHLNSLVEGYYNSYLATFSRIPPAATKFPIFDSTAFHSMTSSLSEDDTILQRIIDSLLLANHLRPESHMPLRIIQGSLMSLRFHELVEELNRQLQKFKEDPEYDPCEESANHRGGPSGLDVSDCRTLRVVVHILLVIQSINAGFTPDTPYHEAAENVIAAYIDFLAEVNKHTLVPLYAGRLSPQKSVEVMGKILRKITDEAQRDEMIRLMRKHHIDVAGSLKTVMKNILELTKSIYETSGTLPERGVLLRKDMGQEEITEEDDMCVQGLQWLMLGGDELRGEVVRMGGVVYRRFLLTGRLAAAKTIYNKINSKSFIPAEAANGFTDAMLSDTSHPYPSTDDLLQLFPDHTTRTAAAIFVEFEIFIRALLHLESWMAVVERRPQRIDRAWKGELNASYTTLQAYLPPIVQSWLEIPLTDDLVLDVENIRKIYIPDLTISLYNVYVDAGKYLQTQQLSNILDLTTIVADPERSLLSCFVETGRVGEFLKCIEIGSRAILGASEIAGAKAGSGGGGLGIWNVK